MNLTPYGHGGVHTEVTPAAGSAVAVVIRQIKVKRRLSLEFRRTIQSKPLSVGFWNSCGSHRGNPGTSATIRYFSKSTAEITVSMFSKKKAEKASDTSYACMDGERLIITNPLSCALSQVNTTMLLVLLHCAERRALRRLHSGAPQSRSRQLPLRAHARGSRSCILIAIERGSQKNING